MQQYIPGPRHTFILGLSVVFAVLFFSSIIRSEDIVSTGVATEKAEYYKKLLREIFRK